jgi:hypothetical protein
VNRRFKSARHQLVTNWSFGGFAAAGEYGIVEGENRRLMDMEMEFGAAGPLVLAAMEVREAAEQSEHERLRRHYASALLHRTDRILDRLEELNLYEVARVPETWGLHIATVVADLPFDYGLSVQKPPTPTEAIDIVFDLQHALLLWMTGVEAEDEALENAS